VVHQFRSRTEPCRLHVARMSHGAGEASVAARDLRASAPGPQRNDQAQLAASGQVRYTKGIDLMAMPQLPYCLGACVAGTGGELRIVSTARAGSRVTTSTQR
jgi:hypothetical protein